MYAPFMVEGGVDAVSPIEKALLRRVRAQTVDALMVAIAQALNSVSPYDAIGYFVNASLFTLDQ